MKIKITTDIINTLFIAFIASILNISQNRVVVETRAGIRPDKGLYVGIWWQDLETLTEYNGDAEYSEYDSDGVLGGLFENRNYTSLCKVRFTIYGNDALNQTIKLRSAVDSDSRFKDLWQILGFAGCESTNDISTEFNGVIHQRAYFDLSFYLSIGAEFDTDYFTSGQFRINNGNIFYVPDKFNFMEEC